MIVKSVKNPSTRFHSERFHVSYGIQKWLCLKKYCLYKGAKYKVNPDLYRTLILEFCITQEDFNITKQNKTERQEEFITKDHKTWSRFCWFCKDKFENKNLITNIQDMSILLRFKFVGGKPKYYHESEDERRRLDMAIQFAKDHEGIDCYKEFFTIDEIMVNKNLSLYYRKILLPPIFEKMKVEYNISTHKEADAILCSAFGKLPMKKTDGRDYDLIQRIEEMTFIRQGDFITKVANYGVSKFNLKFPNANEIEKAKQ